jgi:hypothetical protein
MLQYAFWETCIKKFNCKIRLNYISIAKQTELLRNFPIFERYNFSYSNIGQILEYILPVNYTFLFKLQTNHIPLSINFAVNG